jgi:hypothetical protein
MVPGPRMEEGTEASGSGEARAARKGPQGQSWGEAGAAKIGRGISHPCRKWYWSTGEQTATPPKAEGKNTWEETSSQLPGGNSKT